MTDPRRGEYARFLAEVKKRILNARLGTARSVNRGLIGLYWQIGKAIVEKQESSGWGDEVIPRLARDLQGQFPGVRGFSRSNLFYMRKLFLIYREKGNCPDAIGQLPWSHNLLILNKIEDPNERHWYVEQSLENGWSSRILDYQIDSRLYQRQAGSLKDCNFPKTLPRPQSDLAQELLKDPYHFDFLGLGPKAKERDLERALVDQLSRFLLELGVGFAFVGRQYRLEVAGKDYSIDLLFYHLRLRCLVAIDLKMEDFRPEDAGQMSFYLSALDDRVRHPADQPSVGLILCKSKDRTTVEYSLRDSGKPIGVSAYRLTSSLPSELQGALPTIKQLERELEMPT